MREHLSLETCRALKDLGFPQDEGHFRWTWWNIAKLSLNEWLSWDAQEGTRIQDALTEPIVRCPDNYAAPAWIADEVAAAEQLGQEWVAIPDPLEALEWLREAHGYIYGRWDYRAINHHPRWWAERSEQGGIERRHIAPTAHALVERICQHLQSQQPAAVTE